MVDAVRIHVDDKTVDAADSFGIRPHHVEAGERHKAVIDVDRIEVPES
jgi:hypothetical protein